jgi:phosphatidylserine synthase
MFYTQTNSVLLLFGGIVLSLAYYAAVQYRLKRFNQSGHSSYFEGLPSPIGAGLVLIAAISRHLHILYFFVPIVVISSLLMISRINYPHLTIITKQRFYKFLSILAFLFIILTIINLINTPYLHRVFVYEILFGLTCVYLVSPIFSLKKMIS